uniref:RING-type E3 ubiquitin transferase n=1 Tax=Oryza meridionalis TaxID=40149 RepID=A0A0E0EVW3_9ORYZ
MNLPICLPHIGAHNPRILGRGKCTKLSSSSLSPPLPHATARRRRRLSFSSSSAAAAVVLGSEEGGGGGLFANLARSLSCRALLRWDHGSRDQIKFHQQNPASTIVAIDKNLDTSTPDTYRAPPTPLPYDVGLVLKDNPDLEKTGIKRKIHEHKESLMMDDNESLQKCVSEDKPDEEDVCPICLEEYDEENPRSMTKCEHHFHLCCILEWMERSETCPVCDQITMINAMYE